MTPFFFSEWHIALPLYGHEWYEIMKVCIGPLISLFTTDHIGVIQSNVDAIPRMVSNTCIVPRVFL